MQSLITKLLGPVFYGMGVSEADFASYLSSCMNYIYAILAALVILIIVLIVAHKAKKGTRAFIRGTSVIAFLTAIAVIANMVVTGPLKTNIQTFLAGSNVNLTEETVADSKDVIKRVGEEGLVLVKNNGLLPLDAGNINVFGWGSTNPILGGTGSGSSDGSSAVGILAPGAGNTGLSALGEVMSGAVNPSGRTVDTYVKDLTATPTWNNFGNFAYDNVDDLKQKIAAADPAYEGNMAFVKDG